ncbi:MAG: sugar ABC transporter ATP-binding protein [Rhodobacteraceae bacterium]|jgi:simple sugar transport system ATP-binding protein|uniref:Monosaccharide ABC transporter ATP-binding protein, CUT2 family n=1 Tax=Salipiger profundus TaxID=1229727 RepID=A0A1U7DCW7_9RHOB|nr:MULTISPECIES: sugar ABC transporter ATP-binding protein [Salipiger]APX25910.1 monosaccharide ABC transporter ATP-binding protein, CUT2 family [Salipiger profundus]MAB05067.1 sugar ABC transporter ATP-binding protein [Paracoccaceae bacterium]SFC82423.1 monosaccharide ABC transporter ATP-binding protein, CUT2 family [Salipiger profundus]
MSDGHFLELRGIHKRFGGVHALRGVDVTIDTGVAYHLLGENGCGKSTFIKIISGAHPPSEGEILLDGRSHAELSPIQSLEAGIETVYQDLSLLPNLSVEENVALGEQLVSGGGRLMRRLNRARLRETAREAIRGVGLDSTPSLLATSVSDLPLAIRQRVAIARAIAADARLVIMDEPTTSLTRHEVEALIELVGQLLARDVAVLFVTHKLEECYRIGGQAIVFRDGQCIAQGPLEDYSRAELSHLMTGRELDTMRYRTGAPMAGEVLRVEGASSGAAFEDVSFGLDRGEVLGITGLSDSGRNEVALALAGHQPLTAGQIAIDGAPVHLDSPGAAIARGIGYVPEDRLSEGLFLQKSIYQNEVTLILDKLMGAGGIVDKRKGREAAREISEAMNLNTGDIDMPVSALSGGNQQRVLIGRWLSIEPELLVLHGPTVGVDVGSKDTIYRAIQAMAERGIALVIVSDDLPELLQNCDRILVMNNGRVVDALDAATADEDRIYQSMLGSEHEAA